MLVPIVGTSSKAIGSVCVPGSFLFLPDIGCLARELLLPLVLARLLAEQLLLEPCVPVVLDVIIRPPRQLCRYYRPPTPTSCMVSLEFRS